MYGNTSSYGQIYSKLIQDKPDQPVLASLVGRCLTEDLQEKQKIQDRWKSMCSEAIDQIAEHNPYLPDVIAGEEIPAIDAVAWVQGSRGGFDCRPKLYDGVSKSWKLCDMGNLGQW